MEMRKSLRMLTSSPWQFSTIAILKVRMFFVASLLKLLSKLGLSLVAAKLATILLTLAILIESVVEYILWPLRLLHHEAENVECPPTLFHGRLITSILNTLGMTKYSCYLSNQVADYYFRLGCTRAAIKLALKAFQRFQTPVTQTTLIRSVLSSQDDNTEELLRLIREFSEQQEARPAPYTSKRLIHNKTIDRPLRVGFMCDFFAGQIAQQTLQPQFATHNRECLFPVLYDSAPRVCQELYPGCEYHHVANLGDDALTSKIRKDRIDILFELNGPLRPTNRLGVIKRRAAPVQVNWYNLPATSGIAQMDWVLTDETSVPKEKDDCFVERVYRLTGGATGGWDLPNDIPAAQPPIDQRGVFTFGCFGDFFKINSDVIDTWSEILRLVPPSQLYLKNALMTHPRGRLWVAREFARRGIAPARLRLEGFSSYEEMRRLYSEVDLALDTFPFSGGSTTMVALWQGVPVLTICGNEWRGRTTTSINTSANLHEFITQDRASYIAKAVSYANSPTSLKNLRGEMRNNLKNNSAYYNINLFCQNFETAMHEIWQDIEP